MPVDIITLLDSDFMNPAISFHVMLPQFVLLPLSSFVLFLSLSFSFYFFFFVVVMGRCNNVNLYMIRARPWARVY